MTLRFSVLRFDHAQYSGGLACATVNPIAELIDRHLDAVTVDGLGWGRDFYSARPQWHPMAGALYATGLSGLYGHTGDPRHLEAASATLAALSRARLQRGGWGLGFGYRGLASDTPYSITTVLAGRAFAEHHLITGSRSSLAEALRTARWLIHAMPWSFTGAGAGPWFSPGISDVLPNVASMVGGFLHQARALSGDPALARPARLATAFVVRAQHEDGYWTYGFASGLPAGGVRPDAVVDAVHTAYIIDGLNLALRWEGDSPSIRAAIRKGVEFLRRSLLSPRGLLLEKVVSVDETDPFSATLLDNPRLTQTKGGRGETLVAFPGESRLWGYGAMLGALGRAHARGLCSRDPADWMLRRLLGAQLADASGRFRYLASDRRAFPRHEAHAVEGLSAMLDFPAGWRHSVAHGW